MLRNLGLLLLAGLLVFAGLAGEARAPLYLGGHGGLSLPSDSDLSVDGGPHAEARFSEGYSIGGALGSRLWLQAPLTPDVEGGVPYPQHALLQYQLHLTSLAPGRHP